MKNLIIFFLFLTILSAEDITTTDGEVYTGVTVKRVETDGIVIMTDGGVMKLKFAVLSEEVKKKYGYDPVKVAHEKKLVSELAAKQLQDRERIALEKQHFQEIEAKLTNVAFEIFRVREEGCLAFTMQEIGGYGIASSMASVGGGGGAYHVPGTWMSTGELVIVKGLTGVGEGEKVFCSAYRDGTQELVSNNGEKRTFVVWNFYKKTTEP